MTKFQSLFIIIFAIFHLDIFAQDGSVDQSESNSEKAPYRATSTSPHKMQIINSGSASLYSRIDMIRRATKTIELETFIFNEDTSGKLLLKELVAAAKRGVKVRVLVDKNVLYIKLNEYDAQVLRENGVALRFYNDSSILNVSTVQYRNHRKLMVIDDKEAISGGRNLSDEYFDLNPKFNFLDRDTIIEGDLIPTIRESFDKFWDSKMTENPKPVKMPEPYHPSVENGDSKFEQEISYYNIKMKEARALLSDNAEDEKKLKFVMTTGKENFEATNKHECPEMSFASDKEGAGFLASFNEKYNRRYRLLRKEISKWMKQKIKSEFVIDTPYFLENNFTDDISEQIYDKKNVTVFTNSVTSTDAIHIASVFNQSINRYTPHENFTAYTYKGKYQEEGKVYNDTIKKATWGTHSKSMVFSDDSFMIGTYNMDNRSSQYNAELAIFCSGSKELTADVLNSIKKRMDGSNRLNSEGVPDDCSGLFGESNATKKLFYYLMKVPSHMLQFLL
jgi:putative cardiolipin synthase